MQFPFGNTQLTNMHAALFGVECSMFHYMPSQRHEIESEERARTTQCIMMNISIAGGFIHFNAHFLHFTLITSRGETFPFVKHTALKLPQLILYLKYFTSFSKRAKAQHALQLFRMNISLSMHFGSIFFSLFLVFMYTYTQLSTRLTPKPNFASEKSTEK